MRRTERISRKRAPKGRRAKARRGPRPSEAPPAIHTAAVPTDDELLALVRKAARLAVGRRLLRNLSDAESIADEAVVTALGKFDSSRGVAFASYFLTIFIRAARRSKDGWGAVPRGVANALWLVTQWHDFLMEFLERKPTVDEIAEASGLTVERIRKVLWKWQPVVHPESLDAPLNAGGEAAGADPLRREPIASDTDIETQVIEQEQLRLVLAAARRLPPKLRAVIACDLAGMTDAEIAAKLRLKENAVRQRRINAHRKIQQMLVAMPGKVLTLTPRPTHTTPVVHLAAPAVRRTVVLK